MGDFTNQKLSRHSKKRSQDRLSSERIGKLSDQIGSVPQVLQFPAGGSGRHALERAFREHRERLIQYLRYRTGSEAEDIAQSTYMKLLARPHTLAHENLIALIYVTARNLATDHIRRRGRLVANEKAYAAEKEIMHVVDGSVDAERTVRAKQDLQLVLKITTELSEKCRVSFVNYCLKGMNYKDIATQLSITESMVRKHVEKATAYCARRIDELEQ